MLLAFFVWISSLGFIVDVDVDLVIGFHMAVIIRPFCSGRHGIVINYRHTRQYFVPGGPASVSA